MSSQRGFTLIELLVIVGIIATLAGVVVASMNGARQKARMAAGKQMDASIANGLADSLIGQWLFDECSGANAQDSSGNAYAGSFSGAPGWGAETPSGAGCSLTFSGTDYVALPTLPLSSSSDVTIAAWFKTASVPSTSTIVSLERSVGYMRIELNSPGRIVGYFYDGGHHYVGNVSVSSDAWHFAVFTKTGNTYTLYLDGALHGSTSAGASIVEGSGLDSIGARDASGGYSYNFLGSIDNVRIFSRSLTAVEIQKMYALEARRCGIAARVIGSVVAKPPPGVAFSACSSCPSGEMAIPDQPGRC